MTDAATALDALTTVWHDQECDDGDTTSCPRWLAGLKGNAPSARHVDFYRDRARAGLAAAAPVIAAQATERLHAELRALGDDFEREGAARFSDMRAYSAESAGCMQRCADRVRALAGDAGLTAGAEPR